MNGAAWFVLGALFMAVLIFVGERILAWRQDRIDRHNVETMAKMKDAVFGKPFDVPVITSELCPENTIYAVNLDYLYLNGEQATTSMFAHNLFSSENVEPDITATVRDQVAFIMDKNSKAKITNIGES